MVITWEEFENECIKNIVYTIDNESNKNIILFGNCTIAPIGFFLNELMNKKYNIHFIVSWLFELKGFEMFNMELVNNKIQNLLNKANIVLYQNHHKDYGIQATQILSHCNQQSRKYLLPNFHFCFDAPNIDLFNESLDKFKANLIIGSDFKELEFIIDNYKSIRFFNTSVHPTHYLLFLLSKCIEYKIMNQSKIIDIQSYFDENNKNQFKNMNNYIYLPGFLPYTNEIEQITGIDINADYFDY